MSQVFSGLKKIITVMMAYSGLSRLVMVPTLSTTWQRGGPEVFQKILASESGWNGEWKGGVK